MRLPAALGCVAMFVLGCPAPAPDPAAGPDAGAEVTDGGFPPDAGAAVIDGGGEDAGVPHKDGGVLGPTSGSAALASDGGLAFAVGSTVYFERSSNDWIYLFESAAARAAFCGVQPTQGHRVVLGTLQQQLEDGGTYALPGEVFGRIEQADGGSWYASEGQLTVSLNGAPVTAVTGSFALGDFNIPSVLPGSLTGTFEAHRCEPRPWVDGGTGANSASGTLGFEARTAVGFADTAGRFDLYVLSRDLGVDACAQLGSGAGYALLRLAFERTGTGATETFEVKPLVVSRWDVLPDGGFSAPFHAREGILAATFTDGGVSGTYEASFLGPNGALESIQGSYDAKLCP